MARLLLALWLVAAGCLSGCGATKQESSRDLLAPSGWFAMSEQDTPENDWLGGDAPARAAIFALALVLVVAVGVGAVSLSDWP